MNNIVHNSRILAKMFKTKHANIVRLLVTAIDIHGRTDFYTHDEEYHGKTFIVYTVSSELLCLAIFNSANNKAKQILASKLGQIDDILQAMETFEVPDDMPDMYVYAIRNEVTGNVKIGISKNPEQRLKSLQTGNDCDLTLITYFKAENRFKDEAKLHLENKDCRVRGEWFKLPQLT